MPRGGKREGAGRRSAFGRGVEIERRAIRLPPAVWAQIDALAAAWETTDAAVIARVLAERSAAKG